MHLYVCRKDDIFRQRLLNHSGVGGGIAFRRVYPARAYSTVVVLVLATFLFSQKYFAHKPSFWVKTIFVFVLILETKFFVTTNFLDITFFFTKIFFYLLITFWSREKTLNPIFFFHYIFLANFFYDHFFSWHKISFHQFFLNWLFALNLFFT